MLVLGIVFSLSAFASTAPIWPVPASERITQYFNPPAHSGIDIGASNPGVDGDNINSIYNGTVGRAGWSPTYGWVVYIFHEGTNKIFNQNVQSRYAHLMDTPLVSLGDNVSSGSRISYMGNTGRSSGTHLHLEIRVCGNACDDSNNSTPVDPLPYFSGAEPEFISVPLQEKINKNQTIEDDGVFYSTESFLSFSTIGKNKVFIYFSIRFI